MDIVTLGAALALSNKKLAAAMQAIPPAYTYKGSVATVGDLPESADLGDLYTVGGTQYVWDGTEWVIATDRITDAQIDALFE